jgi:monothiol glutaredoxin
MPLEPALQARIEDLLSSHPVVLFMKGSPQAPNCGFSAKAAGILGSLIDGYAHVDVLQDAEIREGIKVYGSWPTIPQLYIRGELIGGSDIIEQLLNSGELHQLLGLPEPDRSPPPIHITPAAANAIRAAMENQDEGLALHLSIDGRFNAQFQLKPAEGNEVRAESAGIEVLLDLASAQRAKGLEIDWVEDVRGAGLAIRNPNATQPVQSLSVADLKSRLDAGSAPLVIDVRAAAERGIAAFPVAHEALDEDSYARLSALPKDQPLAFLCHHGNSSRQAAEHFRSLGFRQVFNIEGGIEAWSTEVDASVPRY